MLVVSDGSVELATIVAGGPLNGLAGKLDGQIIEVN